MINDYADESIFLYHFLIDIKVDCKDQWEAVMLSSVPFIYCFINVIKWS